MDRESLTARSALGGGAFTTGLKDLFAATKTTHIWQVARLLLKGKPVPRREIAEQLGLDPGEVDATLQQPGPGVEYDDNGDLVSFAISLTPTPHRYTVDGVPLYVWCAGDALGFPALFGHTADVETTDPVTGEKIRARVGPKGIEWISHKDAVLSMPTNSAALGEDVRGLTCANIHLFASEESAKQWTAERPGTTIIDLDQLKTLMRELLESGFLRLPGT